MSKHDLIEALNGIDEAYLAETAELLIESTSGATLRKRRRIIKTALTAGVAALLAACLLLTALLKQDPAPLSPTDPSPSTESTSTQPPPFGDVNALIEVRRSYVNGMNYIDFTPTDEILSLCQYIDENAFTLPEYIPTRFNRTDCMPFQNMHNMVNMALSSDSIPVWLASYLLVNFERDEYGIALPDPNNLYQPTLPQSFYTGIVYMLSDNYRVQILSHYFTNGIFDAFDDDLEYTTALSKTLSELENDPEVLIQSVEECETDGIHQKLVSYLKDGIRYTRVESSFWANGKSFYTVEDYPMPFIGGSEKVDPFSGYPESLMIFVEQDGVYGWFYLTQFGRELSLEDVACFGLRPYNPIG